MITVNGKKVAGVGPAGLSPYQVAKASGYTGTEQEFNQQLAQLNQLFTSVSDGKSAIAAAITDKGVTTAADASFQTMATNIGQIPSGGGAFTITNNTSVVYPESAEPGEYVDGTLDGVTQSFSIVGDVSGKSIPWNRSGTPFAGVYSFIMPAENVTISH